MRKPRTTFAAPFVLVVGCGGQTPPPEREHQRPRPDAAVEVDAAVAQRGCKDIELTCIDGPQCEAQIAEGRYEGPVRRARGGEGGMSIYVDLPRDTHVAYWWKGVFVGADGSAIGGTEFDVIEAGPDLAIADVPGRCDLPSNRVRLWAPASGPPVAHHDPTCCRNPPVPQPPPRPNPVTGRIIKTEVVDGTTALTVGVGSSDGVDRHWHAQLLDDQERRVADLLIIRVLPHQVIVRLDTTDVTGSKVRLTPP